MRRIAILSLLLCGCGPRPQETIWPKHIEPPTYPPIARAALIQGVVTLAVTIDSKGNVRQVSTVSGPPLLAQSASKNIQQWTFSEPKNPPFVRDIVYEFKLEGTRSVESRPRVSFDLPDRVTIVTQPMEPEWQSTPNP